MSKNLKLSDYFNLNKSQAELDFIDIYIEKDLPFFINPWAVRQWSDDFSIRCHELIWSFFEELINKIKNNDEDWALEMLSWLHEPYETHLWLTSEWTSWSAIWKNQAEDIYNKLKESSAVKTGYLNDLEDTALLIEWIKDDKISDIVTNIIRKELVQYTIDQCNLYKIPLRANTPLWHYWDDEEKEWTSVRDGALIINQKIILLVPKIFIRKKLIINSDEFYNIDILEFEQAFHLDRSTSLCKTLKKWIKKPSKKDLKETHPEKIKEYILKFSKENPKVLSDYKKNKEEFYKPILNEEIDEEIDIKSTIKKIIEDLNIIKTWTNDALKYENIVLSILNILFYPELTYPISQDRINEWRKIIDISFQNTSNNWFFWDLPKIKIACHKIYFECKNYSNDPVNPEVDQLNGRFSNNISEIWFIVCRKIQNKELFYKRCKDLVHQNRHYIIWLDDDDLIFLLECKSNWNSSKINDILKEKLNILNK